MKKYVSLKVLLVTMLFMVTVISSPFVGAANNKKINKCYTQISCGGYTLTVSNEVLDEVVTVTKSEAVSIAEDFISDMIASGCTEWDSSTKIKKTVKLYDQTNTVNAYCMELTSGYIVVSAYLDSDCLIPEWSDIGKPLYSTFKDSGYGTGKIIYLGGYEYYLNKNSSNAYDLNGKVVAKTSMNNHFKSARNTNNIPLSTFGLTPSKGRAASSGPITNPIVDANTAYNGDFVCSEYTNVWEPYIEKNSSGQYNLFCGTDANSYGWYASCGPVAITNIVETYKNRYPSNYYIPENRKQLINIIASHGTSHNTNGIQWYINGTNIYAGTSQYTEHKYIYSCFTKDFKISCSVTPYDTSYANIKASLDKGGLVYINVFNHSYYGSHAMMCYAYTRLRDNNTGYYKTYLKVADGFSRSPRYVDLATCLNNPANGEYGDFSYISFR